MIGKIFWQSKKDSYSWIWKCPHCAACGRPVWPKREAKAELDRHLRAAHGK